MQNGCGKREGVDTSREFFWMESVGETKREKPPRMGFLFNICNTSRDL